MLQYLKSSSWGSKASLTWSGQPRDGWRSGIDEFKGQVHEDLNENVNDQRAGYRGYHGSQQPSLKVAPAGWGPGLCPPGPCSGLGLASNPWLLDQDGTAGSKEKVLSTLRTEKL